MLKFRKMAKTRFTAFISVQPSQPGGGPPLYELEPNSMHAFLA